jgi:tetratricopeptide (TPR) repeat protein
MRFVVLIAATFLSLDAAALAAAASAPARHGHPAESTIERPAESRSQKIDRLFAELKREGNAKAAERIARRIQQEWSQSGSASVDLMMQWAQKAAAARKYDVALDFLDQVVTLQPDFAEGWNRRATIHYTMKNYAKSMADIDRTLKLEPRHYGAISGLARIMSDTDRKEPAIAAWQRVLDVYPALRAAQDQLSRLSEEIAGQSI